MRSIKLILSKTSATGWDGAVILLEAYLSENLKANQLLDRLPHSFEGERRANCQSLFLGALRHGHGVKHALQPLLRKHPRSRVMAILLVAGYELIEADAERMPKIVHHAVERSKKLVATSELGFLNAVLRKLPKALDAINETTPAAFYSHPQWLVKHWEKELGPDVEPLLAWNQHIPATYIKFYKLPAILPPGLAATNWPGFYQITSDTSWENELRPLLNQGTAYIKDPSTRIAPRLLAPQAGESVLDLCAAPGGKAYDMAHSMQRTGLIVAVDLPGNRIQRLQENLAALTTETLQCPIIEKDVLKLQASDFSALGLPESFDAVMLDAPCSNTGVIQRRTDVKWRLEPVDLEHCTALQSELLQHAAGFVKPGGRIVYSTCSIENSENERIVQKFLKSEAGQDFELKASEQSFPWVSGHDGAGAFLMQRK
ncbi:MAG: 16S rRNA (cytosine967-C5)-methyltransferase [Lentimonas sp.]|jgi:16S rRNA (cytosine967-C5)-methyltransferase